MCKTHALELSYEHASLFPINVYGGDTSGYSLNEKGEKMNKKKGSGPQFTFLATPLRCALHCRRRCEQWGTGAMAGEKQKEERIFLPFPIFPVVAGALARGCR